MTIGVTFPSSQSVEPNAVDTYIDLTREAAEAGIKQAWFAQLFDYDAVTLAALAGRAAPGIEVGTGIVPIFGRHPLTIANGALTAQAATHGRFTLGIGMASPMFAKMAFGGEWERPITRLREYLQVLRSLLTDGAVDFQGETVTSKTPMPAKVPGADPVPIIVAAMGPQALKVTGELADGTLPYLAAPKVLDEFIVPTVTKAAAGRPRPRVIAIVPGVVTANVDEVRENARTQLGLYGTIPSYRAVLDRAGVDHAADLALIGDEDTVAQGIKQYFEAGATDVLLSQTSLGSDEDRRRTWALLGQLARG